MIYFINSCLFEWRVAICTTSCAPLVTFWPFDIKSMVYIQSYQTLKLATRRLADF